MTRRSNSAARNLRTAGKDAAKFAGRTTGKAAVGLTRWAATDHYGMGKAFDQASKMGFFEGFTYILIHFVLSIVASVLTAMLIVLLIFFVIPFLLTGQF